MCKLCRRRTRICTLSLILAFKVKVRSLRRTLMHQPSAYRMLPKLSRFRGSQRHVFIPRYINWWSVCGLSALTTYTQRHTETQTHTPRTTISASLSTVGAQVMMMGADGLVVKPLGSKDRIPVPPKVLGNRLQLSLSSSSPYLYTRS